MSSPVLNTVRICWWSNEWWKGHPTRKDEHSQNPEVVGRFSTPLKLVLDLKHQKVSPGFSKLGMRIFVRTFMDSRGAMNGASSLELGWDMMPLALGSCYLPSCDPAKQPTRRFFHERVSDSRLSHILVLFGRPNTVDRTVSFRKEIARWLFSWTGMCCLKSLLRNWPTCLVHESWKGNPPAANPIGNKAFIRPYSGMMVINNPFIKGRDWGGALGSQWMKFIHRQLFGRGEDKFGRLRMLQLQSFGWRLRRDLYRDSMGVIYLSTPVTIWVV